jgi:hypothetical protein
LNASPPLQLSMTYLRSVQYSKQDIGCILPGLAKLEKVQMEAFFRHLLGAAVQFPGLLLQLIQLVDGFQWRQVRDIQGRYFINYGLGLAE